MHVQLQDNLYWRRRFFNNGRIYKDAWLFMKVVRFFVFFFCGLLFSHIRKFRNIICRPQRTAGGYGAHHFYFYRYYYYYIVVKRFKCQFLVVFTFSNVRKRWIAVRDQCMIILFCFTLEKMLIFKKKRLSHALS